MAESGSLPKSTIAGEGGLLRRLQSNGYSALQSIVNRAAPNTCCSAAPDLATGSYVHDDTED